MSVKWFILNREMFLEKKKRKIKKLKAIGKMEKN